MELVVRFGPSGRPIDAWANFGVDVSGSRKAVTAYKLGLRERFETAVRTVRRIGECRKRLDRGSDCLRLHRSSAAPHASVENAGCCR